MKKKILGMAFISLGLLGLITGCGSKKSATDDSGAKDTGPLQIWSTVLKPSQTVKSWKDSPFHTGLAEASGIKADWEFPAEGTDNNQALNLLLSDEKLPDIMAFSVGNDGQQYIDDGVIQDLTDLLPKKAPHYWKYLQENPEIDKAVKTDDGKYYAFGMFKESDVQAAFYGPEVRQDWLDEQHLKMPTNIAEYENVIRVFNEKYGAKLAFVPNDLNFAGFSGAFGAHGTFGLGLYVDGDKKVKATQEQAGWKEYITWLNKLYKDGLIDPDVLTLDDEGLKTKVANGKVGVTYNLSSRVKMYEDNSKSSSDPQDWSWAPYPNQPDGSKSASIFTQGRAGGTTFWMVSTSAKGAQLDKALKWLDWAFTDEGNIYWNFGKKGVSWEEKDGQHVWTDKVVNNPLGISVAKQLYTGMSGTGLGVQLLESLATTTNGIKGEKFSGEIWDDDNKEAKAAIIPEQVSKTSEESKEAATITNTLDSYCSENALKFMTGEKSLNEYDNFIKELKKQGLDRLIEINQTAYDRYLKR